MPVVGLVIPSHSYRGPDFVAAAEELGVDLIVASDGDLPAVSGRILEVVPISCDAPEEAAARLVAASERHGVEAVLGVDDGGVMVAALAAARLGLAHDRPEAVAATGDKAEMRRLLGEAGVGQARFAVAEDAAAAVAAADAIGYPVVLKPRGLSASRGVIRADDAPAVEAAFERVSVIIAEAGGSPPLLVEEYLRGEEVAVEALATPGGLEVLAIFDKPDPLDGPFFEETIYVTPSRYSAAVQGEVEDLVSAGVAAIGLAHGPVHAEVRLTPDGPRLVEVAARSIGGLCGRSLRFGLLGQSLEVLLLRAALGLNRRGMRRRATASGAMMLPIPADGVLLGVRGTEAVAEVPGITGIEITIPPGRSIRRLPEGDRYLGFLFAEADTPDEVVAALREAHGLLEVMIA